MNGDVKLYDLYDVIYEPFWIQAWFVYASACIGIIIVGCVAYYIYKRWFQKKIFQTPAQRFSQILDQLVGKIVARSITQKQFYQQLTHELKYYLGKQFEIDLVDKTDYELIEALQKTSFGREHVHELKKILDNAVAVKFAQESVDHNAQLRDVDWCKKQIELNQSTLGKSL